ncbi:MAG: carboxypeptidase-like regulatory domain-containing protein, partial [Vulcanimicrobiaceae bacterium]
MTKQLLRRWRCIAAFMAVAFAISGVGAPMTALAGTTGNITGTATDYSTGAPLAGVKVSATSLSQSATTTTDAHGFYSLLNLGPDTYTLSFQKDGY